MSTVDCPEGCTKGYHHSSGDGWDEWDECKCCNPDGENDTGKTTQKRIDEFRAACAAEDARIEEIYQRESRRLCPKCGLRMWDHANRDGESCKSIEQFNREYLAEVEKISTDTEVRGS